MKEKPLISCLCISHNNVDILKRSMTCFFNQTYPNKELVIVYSQSNIATHAFLSEIDDARIVKHSMHDFESVSLGNRRNLSVEISQGTYFCVWDDDDWYHPKRLEKQFQALKRNFKQASILLNCLFIDCREGQSYVSSPYPLYGSILCEKSLFADHKFGDANRHEDAAFVLPLLKNNFVYPIIQPTAYLYIYHGANISGYQHFNFFKGQKLPQNISTLLLSIVDGQLSNREASRLLDSRMLLSEIEYFNWMKFS